MNLYRFVFPQKDPYQVKKDHQIPDTIQWDIELNKNGLVATSESLPGLVTNASNPEDLLEMINDAVLEYFDVSKRESAYVFDSLNLAGHGTVYLKQVKEKHQYA